MSDESYRATALRVIAERDALAAREQTLRQALEEIERLASVGGTGYGRIARAALAADAPAPEETAKMEARLDEWHSRHD